MQNKALEERHHEGELYKTIELCGRTFTLYYGYYEECDRQNPLCDPIVIYPDFLKNPIYTDDGKPFVTVIQNACSHFKGKAKRTPDTTCAECICFEPGEDWIAICNCGLRQKKKE